MHREEPVSATHQMYLKALYRLTRTSPVGRVRDIAKELSLTSGTVSTALNKLQELGLVEREHYGGAVLTPTGSALARCVVRRYETLRALLIELFGVGETDAENDACLMEHSVSPASINRMEALLEHLHAGESIDLKTLEAFQSGVGSACPDCEAAGFCRAAAQSQEVST